MVAFFVIAGADMTDSMTSPEIENIRHINARNENLTRIKFIR